MKRQMGLGDRGNGRIKTTSLLTDDEKAEVSVNHAISRVIKGGVYTDVFNNYCPGLLTKYNLSAKSTRPMLFDIFKMFISDQPEHPKRVRIMHKSGIARKLVALAAILGGRNLSQVNKANSLCVGRKIRERSSNPHNQDSGLICRFVESNTF